MSFLKRFILTVLLFPVAAALGQTPRPQARSDRSITRDAWFQRGRVVPSRSAATLRQHAYQQKLQLRKAQLGASAQATLIAADVVSQVWQPLGPSPLASDASGFGQQDYGWVSGRATSIVIDRSDPSGNTLYLGGAFGGVWKSSNAATPDQANVVWTPLIDDQPTLAVGAIAIQPQSNNPDPSRSVVLVGTGEVNSSTDSYYGLGILRSTNAGLTWNLISQDATGTHSFAGLGLSKISFSTANPNLAVAAVAGASQGLIEGLANPPSPNLGIYYSSDGGASWNLASITDLGTTIAPSSVTSIVYNDATGIFMAAVRTHGYYVSIDGSHWTRLVHQPGAGLNSAACPPATSQNCPIYRGELAAVSGRNEIYAWYVDASDNDQGIWKTLDGGNSWTQISTTSITTCGDSLGGCGTESGAYNLTLSAVANGATATDLYAGAVNLYKCSINSQSPACNGPNTFLNLTHTFGCSPNLGVLAHVHPAQHAIDSLVVNGKSLLYIANDGGAYRALDGYTGLTSEDCASSNQFDSLNKTLGSMTLVVAFAQHPSDGNTLLGGAQGNGSPATAQALAGVGWQNVNSGDGGYSEINPANPDEWFTSHPGVNIQRCTLGIACHAQDFEADPVVSSATLDGDAGPFYTPFILDPQNPSEMIVGTCRLWRGGGDGSNFTMLSNNLDTGSATPCSGNEANLVRSIAVGGSKNTSGFSQVIYAGTDGFGPLVSTTPAAGRVWVSRDADGGPSTWIDRTGLINPQHFPISSIAVDPSDGNGTRAYAAIMGFHVPHLWMTPSGGVSWFNFNGNLPDAPVNAIVLDPGDDPSSGNINIYVGTDVGVFVSSTATPIWTEVGPASGQSGFLPNVPVTALRIFKSGITKLLRASTYGRGLWQFALSTAPDFQLAFPNPTQTIFPSQTASFLADVTRINGYASPVNLTCAAGNTPLPGVCSVNPASVTPGAAAQPFVVSAGGGVGDYAFFLHAAGTDTNHVSHDAALALHVVDFDLTSPAPSIVGAQPDTVSSPSSFQLTARGSFQGLVALSCTGLPSGASCNFSPGDQVSPRSNAPVATTLTISTATNTPNGVFPVVIHASTPGAPEKTQPVSLKVGLQEYAIHISSPSLTAVTNTAAVFSGTLSTNSNFSDPVNLGCGVSAPPTCDISPSTVVPSASGTPFTVTVRSNFPQAYNFNLVAQGTDALNTSYAAALSFTTTFDFTISPDPSSRTVKAGQSAAYEIDLAPKGGSFPFDTTVTCSGLPSKTSCALNPTRLTAGSPETAAALTIATTASVSSSIRVKALALAGVFLPFLMSVFTWKIGASAIHRLTVLVAIALLLGSLVACGGGLVGGGGGGGGGSGSQTGTTPGTYIIIVTAATGSLTHSTSVTLTVQ